MFACVVAEKEGFEPSVQLKLYAGFRIRCIRPLCHLSAVKPRILAGDRRCIFQAFRCDNGSPSVRGYSCLSIPNPRPTSICPLRPR